MKENKTVTEKSSSYYIYREVNLLENSKNIYLLNYLLNKCFF